MASIKKIKKFFEVSGGTNEAYNKVIESIVVNIKDYYNDEEGSANAEFYKRFQLEIGEKVFGIVIKIYSENFSDEEMDELISMYSLPVIKKLSTFVQQANKEISDFLNDNEEYIEKMVQRIANEVMQEFNR